MLNCTMKHGDFISMIGYDAQSAIIDKQFARKYGQKNSMELAELGYYKAALCSALYYDNAEECEQLMKWLHEHDLFIDFDFAGLISLFGVHAHVETQKVTRI